MNVQQLNKKLRKIHSKYRALSLAGNISTPRYVTPIFPQNSPQTFHKYDEYKPLSKLIKAPLSSSPSSTPPPPRDEVDPLDEVVTWGDPLPPSPVPLARSPIPKPGLLDLDPFYRPDLIYPAEMFPRLPNHYIDIDNRAHFMDSKTEEKLKQVLLRPTQEVTRVLKHSMTKEDIKSLKNFLEHVESKGMSYVEYNGLVVSGDGMVKHARPHKIAFEKNTELTAADHFRVLHASGNIHPLNSDSLKVVNEQFGKVFNSKAEEMIRMDARVDSKYNEITLNDREYSLKPLGRGIQMQAYGIDGKPDLIVKIRQGAPQQTDHHISDFLHENGMITTEVPIAPDRSIMLCERATVWADLSKEQRFSFQEKMHQFKLKLKKLGVVWRDGHENNIGVIRNQIVIIDVNLMFKSDTLSDTKNQKVWELLFEHRGLNFQERLQNQFLMRPMHIINKGGEQLDILMSALSFKEGMMVGVHGTFFMYASLKFTLFMLKRFLAEISLFASVIYRQCKHLKTKRLRHKEQIIAQLKKNSIIKNNRVVPNLVSEKIASARRCPLLPMFIICKREQNLVPVMWKFESKEETYSSTKGKIVCFQIGVPEVNGSEHVKKTIANININVDEILHFLRINSLEVVFSNQDIANLNLDVFAAPKIHDSIARVLLEHTTNCPEDGIFDAHMSLAANILSFQDFTDV